jgi:mono/diheme cytochrome c family protein
MKRVLLLSAVTALFLALPAQAADKKVERLFNSKCGSCHGKDGKGQTEKGKKMAVRDMTSEDFLKGKDDDFKKTINDGLKKEEKGVKQEMDGYKAELKADDVDNLVKYIRELKK